MNIISDIRQIARGIGAGKPGRYFLMKGDFDAELYEEELNGLKMYPKKAFIDTVKDVGFNCDLCGRCCTGEYNDHVFLLEDDADLIRSIDPSALMPSPYFDVSDQNGVFYVVGYSLRIKDDDVQSCVFLENNRCTIYEKRPTICRVYPYMIHREPDEKGHVDWREISGLNEHGTYENEISDEEAEEIYQMTDSYEKKYLEQEIAFRKTLRSYFDNNGLKVVRRDHDRLIRKYEKEKTGEITVMVYHRGGFIPENFVIGE